MQRLLDKINKQLVAHYDPDKIILFGSAAKGQLRPDSDIDILVIGRFSGLQSLRGEDLHGFWHSLPVRVDVLYFTAKEVEQHCLLPNSFVKSALSSGKIIFEKNG